MASYLQPGPAASGPVQAGPAAHCPLPHHDGSPLHAPRHTALGDTARLRIRVPAAWGYAARVWVRSVQDGEPRYDAARSLGESDGWTWWESEMTVTNPVARYRFLLEVAAVQYDGGTPGAGRPGTGTAAVGQGYWSLNAQGLFRRDVSDYADFRLTAFPAAPQWLRRGTMYQVFPDRFARSADAGSHPAPDWAIPSGWDHTPVQGTGPATPFQFYGGDLTGVAEKLDHIQGLGADIIYLTPFFPARSNHRYDASTFNAVDPLLGGDGALVKLVEAAHARGIKVMGDLTANHSGDAHEWFRRALADPACPESGYYYFTGSKEEGSGQQGSGEQGARTYEAWYGVASLPKLNWSSDELKHKFVLDDDSPVARWLRPPFNLDGWRIDVGNMTGRLGATDLNREVARLIADRVRDINPEAALLAEATNDAAPDFTGEHWHGAMTYANFTRPLWSWLAGDAAHVNFFGTPLAGPNRMGAEDFLATHLDLAAAFSWDLRLQNMNALNSHDTARAATVMIDGGQLLGAVMMFTLPGVPVVFAGDEFGLTGHNGEDARTPMPWDDPRRVEADLRASYSSLASLRRGQPALTEGGIRWLYADGDALAYVRETAESAVLVFVARAAARADLAAGALSPAQVAALGAEAAFSTGEVNTGAGNAGVSLSAGDSAAAVWVLPGTAVPAV